MPVASSLSRVPRAGVQEGLLTLQGAAEHLQIAPGTLKHWALAGRIEYVKVGKFMRFTQVALDRFVARQTVTAKAEDE